MQPEKPQPEAKRGMSGIMKALLGCGCLTIVGFLACGGLVGYGVWSAVQVATEFAEEYEGKGYVRVDGQQRTETKPIQTETVFLSQQLILKKGADTDIAIAAQIAELEGEFAGDIDFLGQILHVKRDAVVRGDVRVKMGQLIKIDGEVEGEISGSYQVLERK